MGIIYLPKMIPQHAKESSLKYMAKRFDWGVVIKDWEREILKIVEG